MYTQMKGSNFDGHGVLLKQEFTGKGYLDKAVNHVQTEWRINGTIASTDNDYNFHLTKWIWK